MGKKFSDKQEFIKVLNDFIIDLELYCVQNGLEDQQKEIWKKHKKNFPNADLRAISLTKSDDVLIGFDCRRSMAQDSVALTNLKSSYKHILVDKLVKKYNSLELVSDEVLKGYLFELYEKTDAFLRKFYLPPFKEIISLAKFRIKRLQLEGKKNKNNEYFDNMKLFLKHILNLKIALDKPTFSLPIDNMIIFMLRSQLNGYLEAKKYWILTRC